MYGTAQVKCPDGLCHFLMDDAIAGFIAQRPKNDGSMVAVALYHADTAIYKLFFPSQILGNQLIIFDMDNTMTFDIRFINDIKPIFITKIQQAWVGRIMAGPDAVHVGSLHDQHIFKHTLYS